MSTSGRMPRWAFARGSAALAQPGAVPVSLGLPAAAATWVRNPITVHAVPGSALHGGGELGVMPAEVSDLRPGARADEGRLALLSASAAGPRASGAATTRPSSAGCSYCHPGEDRV